MICLPVQSFVFYVFYDGRDPDGVKAHALYVVELVGDPLQSEPLEHHFRVLRKCLTAQVPPQ